MALRILIVDDEADVELLFRQRMRKAVREGLLQLEFAFSGEEAIQRLNSTEHTDIALILSDINMPGMSGYELLEKIKSAHPSMKVVMVTAYGDEQYREKARQLGADDFITKPIDFRQIEDIIQSFSKP
jgi:two-component system response regulator (stage 0 sporulation protein F)